MTISKIRQLARGSHVRLSLAVMAALILAGRGSGRVAVLAQAGGSCASPANIVVLENCQPGHTDWDLPVDANGVLENDPTLQGYAADISVNNGETVAFKIDTVATSYRIDIYRLGYYNGAGARKITSSIITQASPQLGCISDATGLVDCGNWTTSASWDTTGATSGIYLAKLTRTDIASTGASHIVFIVRDDSSHSDLLFQTSDMTWQAYNRYGGNSLYFGNPAGRAYKVSYNRPFDTRGHDARSWVFNAEYPMVRWLEANGYNVSYTTGIDTERRGAELLEHKVFMSVGHDEYWSGQQRANVQAARDAGVHLGFFSGNEMFWKTRWENSIDGSNTPYRTLVTYKETHANAKIDPSPLWTGTFRDPRFSADGGRPENALTGTLFMVNNQIESRSIVVSEAEGKLRFWRNTAAASLAPNSSLVLPDGVLGYEWDTDADNGFRPAGLIHLSSATYDVPGKLQDFGSTYSAGTVSHHLTLYKFGNALVFGAGTVQWAWGLDANHDFAGTPVDSNMKQATVNLFADMGVTAGSLQPGLIAGSASADTTAPTSTITAPAAGASAAAGGHLTMSGTASDAGGGAVAGVEVSVDGGLTWRGATGTSNWTYDWSPASAGVATIVSRATDDSGNVGIPSASVLVTVTASTCPCSHLWNPATAVPTTADANDASAIELGVRFSSDIDGFITAVRFYKSAANNGTHLGNLWTAGGTLLATGTFTNETASGWQELRFNATVPILANTTYVASYHTNVGHYPGDSAYFASSGVSSPPLRAPVSGAAGNGVFVYGASAFPTRSFKATNYWVDVTFAESVADDAAPSITQVRVNALDGTTAVVSWKTNEDADSRVDYSTDQSFPTGQTFSVANSAFVLDHSLTLTGLTPNNTYYFRITSIDRSANPSVFLTPSFTVPGPTLHDTASVDFLAGSGTTYVSQNADGEVTLAPATGAEFYGSSLPPGWTSVLWDPAVGGSVSVNGGVLTVDGARVGTCDGSQADCEQGIFAPGHSLEFVATFTGDPFQHAGFGVRFDARPWAMFSTGGGAELLVRTFSESEPEIATSLGTNLLGAPHRFRIDWATSSVTYFVDGVQVASHAKAIAGPMRPIAASDFKPGGGHIVVDWIHALPYATSGSFVSRVFDAGTAVDWMTILWKGVTPAGTSLAIYERTGDTPTPDTTWTNFAAVPAPGEFTRHPHARYVQYRADLATSNASITPELQDILVSTAHAPVAVNDAATTTLNASKTFSGNPLNPTSLMVNDTDSDSPKAQLRIASVSAPAHGIATINPVSGAVTYIPATGYTGADSFTYTISDGLLISNAATVSMTVGNRPPVADDDGSSQAPAYVVNEDSTLTVGAVNRVTANDSDPDNDPVTAVLVTDATHGHVTLNADGSFVYTPNPDTFGPDQFSYQVRDSFGEASNIATVYIGVTSVNDAPSFTKGGDQTVVGVAGAQTVPGWAAAISAGPSDEAGQTLNFLVTNSNNALFSVQPAVAADGTLTFTPAPTMTGAANVTVQLQDNGGIANGGSDTSAAQSFTITIAAASTATAVTSSNSPSLFGVPITLTASVSSAPGTGVPVGSVTFGDGAATIGSAALAGGIATITTSALSVGTHSITAVYGGGSNFNGSTSPVFSQVISASASLKVTFKVHAMQDGTRNPKVATVAVPNAIVKVFSTADACTGNIFSAINPKKWGVIFDGADGMGGADGCAPVSVGSYQATGVTDANGNATIIVPPLSLNWSSQYLVIARATNFDYIKTAAAMDPVYSNFPVLSVAAGQTKNVPLAMIATFNGKVVPGAQAEFFGSYLNIVQPEFMDWTEEQEQYPFVLVAQGDWDVSTNIAPPSGFTTDATSMTAAVADTTTAVQFTLTDIGSDWTETGVTHVINHKGTTTVQTSSVRMFNRRPTSAKADFWAVMTNSTGNVIPVLHNDVVAPPKTLQITDVTQPANGSVTVTAGGVSYTPNADFTGLDPFTYTITDSEGVTSTASVNVKVGAKPTIFISDASVEEGAKGTETPEVFTVTLSGALEIPVTFDYSTRD
ncbi:MAG TPA: N,N-dimethylformamidase beta subunit family domain-containing protein, partial [Vicinamibacterales bacterium]|nr:N,N-dimethylformamidase beta subunit family domain-containing protein [Vicinamibacterales bacterium]